MTIRQGWYESPEGYEIDYTVVWYDCRQFYPFRG